jgi:putative oxidoreductase
MNSGSPLARGYALLVTAASSLQSPFLLAVRLFWGFQFAQAGWGKFFGQGIPKVAEFFGGLGIPLPYVGAVMASTTELVGGVLLMLGLCTRLTAIPLIFTMIVAYLTTEMDAIRGLFGNPDDFLKATPFLFLFACLILLIFGPGAFSVDYLLKRNSPADDRR